MSMESLNNIKALTRIQLRQNKKRYLLLLIVVLIMFLYSVLDFAFDTHGTSSYLINISPLRSSYIFLIFIYIAYSALNIITNKRISLFPGTNNSRFISRILSDFIMIISILLLSFVLYGVQFLILFLYQRFGRDIDISYAFDLRYGLYSLLYLFSYFLLFYSTCVFIGILYTKLKNVKFFLSFSCFGICIIFVMKFIDFSQIFSFFINETDIGIFLLKVWSISLMLLFISFQIVQSIKTMEPEESQVNLVFAPIVIILFFVALAGDKIVINNYTGKISIYNYKDSYIYNKQIVPYYGNIKKLPNNFSVATLYEAKRAGFVDANFTLSDDEVLAISFLPDTKCKGKNLYGNYLDNLHISYKSPEFHYEMPETKTIINFPFGGTYKFMDGYKIGKFDYLDSYSNRNNVVVFLVTND